MLSTYYNTSIAIGHTVFVHQLKFQSPLYCLYVHCYSDDKLLSTYYNIITIIGHTIVVHQFKDHSSVIIVTILMKLVISLL